MPRAKPIKREFNLGTKVFFLPTILNAFVILGFLLRLELSSAFARDRQFFDV
jgi:hypothetical protein